MSILNDFADTVTVYRGNEGDFGGTDTVSVTGSSLTGHLQTARSASSRQYEADGERKVLRVFFTADPSIDENDLLKVVTTGGETYWLHVDSTQKDANPKHTLKIWFVDCHELTQAEFPTIT